MKISEVENRLKAGDTLDTLFYFRDGQECLIFKSDRFMPGDEVIYIPDIYLNEIKTHGRLSGYEEIAEFLTNCYTGDDFIRICGGNADMAEVLFRYCDWQHPSSAYPEIQPEEVFEDEK